MKENILKNLLEILFYI